MELLAPAGGFEQLRCALHFGADAVYLGATRYGLRARADNFSDSELARAIDFTHKQGKKAYVAANALLHPDDIESFRTFLMRLEALRADAAIVSDLAAFTLAAESSPNLPLHVSTQASCTNAVAASRYAQLGAKRIVLARELSLEEIAQIHQAVPDVELEVFVHGAMCIAYSGRCLISDYLVGRDANRGDCTQPCRWSYALEEEKRPGEFFPIEQEGKRSFVMSSADLNMIEHLDDLARAGITSLKIEGRAKGAYYVACTTHAYRSVLDGADPSKAADELETVSHRPYHSGFFYGTPAQAYEGDEYIRTCDFVGTIDTCTPSDKGFRCALRLRNRFFAGDELEALSPGKPVRAFTVTGIEDERGMPQRTADRTNEIYTFDAPFSLDAFDVVRKRR